MIERALRLQDANLKKYLHHSQSGLEANEVERKTRQNDSLHRQIRTSEISSKDAGVEI